MIGGPKILMSKHLARLLRHDLPGKALRKSALLSSLMAIMLVGCGPRPPSADEIKRAYATRTTPLNRVDGTPLPVFKGEVMEASPGECKYEYNGYFTCRVVISDQEADGVFDKHRIALLMIEWADGWQIRQID